MVSALPSPEHMLRMIEDPDVPRDRLVATIKALWTISNTLPDQVASLTVDLAEARAQEGAGSAPSRAADGWSARDLADELLTLQPVDPARCNPRRKAHPVIGGRELECGECWRVRVVERLEQWRRSVEGQEGAGSAHSRAADGLAGSGWHSGTPATGEARKSAESEADDDDAEWDAREAIERARGER